MAVTSSHEIEHVLEVGGLTAADLARATGADDSTARAWIRGTRRPSRQHAERIAEFTAVVERLVGVMQTDYIRSWLIKPSAALGDDKPLDVIAAGSYRRVTTLLSALEDTAFA